MQLPPTPTILRTATATTLSPTSATIRPTGPNPLWDFGKPLLKLKNESTAATDTTSADATDTISGKPIIGISHTPTAVNTADDAASALPPSPPLGTRTLVGNDVMQIYSSTAEDFDDGEKGHVLHSQEESVATQAFAPDDNGFLARAARVAGEERKRPSSIDDKATREQRMPTPMSSAGLVGEVPIVNLPVDVVIDRALLAEVDAPQSILRNAQSSSVLWSKLRCSLRHSQSSGHGPPMLSGRSSPLNASPSMREAQGHGSPSLMSLAHSGPAQQQAAVHSNTNGDNQVQSEVKASAKALRERKAVDLSVLQATKVSAARSLICTVWFLSAVFVCVILPVLQSFAFLVLTPCPSAVLRSLSGGRILVSIS